MTDNAVVSLSRGEMLPKLSAASDVPFKDKARHEAMIDFLGAKARWPGADKSQRMMGLDAELRTMDIAEKVMLQMDMLRREERMYSFEYNAFTDYGRG